MAERLTDEQISELRYVFNKHDKNKDGLITTQELESILYDMGRRPSKNKVHRMVETFDRNESGVIDFPEFLTLIAQERDEPDFEKAIKDAFGVFDKDGNGNISTEDLRRVLMKVGMNITEEETDELISAADEDGDGLINYKTFIPTMFH